MMELALKLAQNGALPDGLLRFGVRRLARQRMDTLPPRNGKSSEDHVKAFIDAISTQSIAILTDLANEQHYEVPPRFFELTLGAHLKYSCCEWNAETHSLDEAEALALNTISKRARLSNGLEILELGCGWGSLTLWMAEHYPQSRILAVSNSAPQRAHIEARAKERGLTNIEVRTEDMNTFAPGRQFDRIVSIEMFEHMRNWPKLMDRVSGWLKPEGLFFLHVFTHREAPYLFEVLDASDWMSQYFFSGGMMPSRDLAPRCARSLKYLEQWTVNGSHYEKTSNAWLKNMDAHKENILPILENTYGASEVNLWWHRWRIFFIACAEVFGYAGGKEWPVMHYLFQKPENAG